MVRQEVGHHLADDVGHPRGVEDALRKREQKNDERKERQDGLRGDGECVGVNLGLEQIAAECFELVRCAAGRDGRRGVEFG